MAQYHTKNSAMLIFFANLILMAGSPAHAADTAQSETPNVTAEDQAHIEALISVVSDDKLLATNPDRVIEAIRELGDLKALKAAPALAERLDLRDNDLPRTYLPTPLQIFPAMGALAKIGEMAIPSIVDAVAQRDRSQLFVNNAIDTIWYIQGKRLSNNDEIKAFQAAAEKRKSLSQDAEALRLLKAVTILKDAEEPSMPARAKVIQKQIRVIEQGPNTPENKTKLAALQLELLNVMISSMPKNAIDVTGDLVDVKGGPVKEVQLVVTQRNPVAFGEMKEESSKRNVDGEFNIKSNAFGIELDFQKDGYYPAVIYLTPGDATGLARQMLPYIQPNGRLKIVLQKKGVLAKLTTCNLELEYKSDGMAAIADLAGLAKKEEPRIRSVKVADGKDIPELAVYFIVDRDADGTITPLTLNRSRPAILHLVVEGKDSGVRVAKLSEAENATIEPGYAPQDGYKQEIQLTGEELLTIQWVFFKIGNEFAKGYLNLGALPIDRKSIKGTLRLLVQEDGTRNLETRH